MKAIVCCLSMGCLTFVTLSARTMPHPPKAVPVEPDLSYALGIDAANKLRKLETPINLPAFHQAVEDVMNGRKQRLPPEDARRLIEERENARIKVVGGKNQEAGRLFLEQNRTRPGVQVTASGLQIEMIREGTGPQPQLDGWVRVHYRGSLTDGSEFDSSYARKEPARLRVAKVIDGWTEALLGMKVGTKVRLTIPWDLAYGEKGRGEIPPCSVLVFELELLGLEVKPQPSTK